LKGCEGSGGARVWTPGAAWSPATQQHNFQWSPGNLGLVASGAIQLSHSQSMFSESHGENIGDDGFALGRFQTRAMRHAVDEVWPIFGAVMPEHRQRVAFDAAMDEKRAAFTQHRKIDMLSLSRGRHLGSDRGHVVGRFATGQQASERDKDRHFLHLRDQCRKSCALGNRLRRAYLLLAREQ
jgi:hypothetical protein